MNESNLSCASLYQEDLEEWCQTLPCLSCWAQEQLALQLTLTCTVQVPTDQQQQRQHTLHTWYKKLQLAAQNSLVFKLVHPTILLNKIFKETIHQISILNDLT